MKVRGYLSFGWFDCCAVLAIILFVLLPMIELAIQPATASFPIGEVSSLKDLTHHTMCDLTSNDQEN